MLFGLGVVSYRLIGKHPIGLIVLFYDPGQRGHIIAIQILSNWHKTNY